MKKKLILALLSAMPLALFGQMQWVPEVSETVEIKHPVAVFDNVVIDKDACTITKDGKTFKLSGKVKIVENWPDLKVQLVDSWPDLKVKLVENWPDNCGKFQLVENWPDIKVKIVENWADIKVKVVENWPGF
ncbi:MAG: hypothetical protein II075_11965 [Bacteroidales bacterium]|nr:hypothetical protein [Bacteroidales bacterium]